tara:strand:+ start:2334 stop:3287 length:954 start_codon:yes stop_codon:yes gene_type:complete
MARQLLVGTDVLAANAGGIQLLKKDAAGEPVVLTATDDLGSAPEIKFCRTIVNGQTGSNICSPWIPGKDIMGWSGVSGVAQTAQSVAITCILPTAAGNTVTLKVIDKSTNTEPFPRENIEFLTGGTANATATNMNTAVAAHIAVNGYKGMIATTGVAGAVVTITGHTYAGPTAAGYNSQTNIEIAFDPGVDAAAAVTVVDTPATSTLGDLFVLADFEKDLSAEAVGDYYRVQQPNNTTYYVNSALGKPYDVYTMTWRSGYGNGQINKVDNMHYLHIAVPSAPGTWLQTAGATALEVQLNGTGGYLFHTPAGTSTVVL